MLTCYILINIQRQKVKLEIYYVNLLYSHQTIQRQKVKLEIYYVNLLYSH